MDLESNLENHNVYHRGVYKVIYKSLHIESKKDLTFSIENYAESSNLKIVISDERDPCFLCVLTLTRNSYDDLKKQQGLLIDFDSFPSQFVRLLHYSVDGNMFLTLQQNANMSMILDIVEHNEFKRLVHLSLTAGPASDADIKKNMAHSVLTLKKKINELAKKLGEDEILFKEKEQMLESKVKDLNMALCRMQDDKMMRETEYQDIIKRERDKLDEERREWKKCAELHSKTQVGTIQESLNRKEKQLEDSRTHCIKLQDTVKNLETQIIDKSQRISNLEKQLHTVRADAETWRTQNAALDREYHDKEINLQHTRIKLQDLEKTLKDKSDLLRETLDSLQTVKKEKNLLDEKFSALEAQSAKHKTESQNTSQQLMKANQIITKLNNDLIEMREKLMCRTAIALEQEKVIEKHSLEVEHYTKKEKEYSGEISKLRAEVEVARLEMDKCTKVIFDKEEIIKNNNTVIQWLHKKLDGRSSQDTISTTNSRGPHNSTPFLSSHLDDRNPLDNNNDIVSAYSAGLNLKSTGRTSRHSIHTDDDLTESGEKITTRLDPIYLGPATDSNKSDDSSKSGTSKENSTTSKGKKISERITSTARSNKSFGVQPKKTVLKGKTLDPRRDPLSPISAYFSRT